MSHGEGVRGGVCLTTGLLRAGVVNEVITWKRYVRREGAQRDRLVLRAVVLIEFW